MTAHPIPQCTLAEAPTTGEAAVMLSGVSKLYGAFAALKHVDLSLTRGTITVLLGENGAGKSTLLRVIAGLTTPSYGQVMRFNGAPGKVAYMAHASMLYDELSARENLDYFASLAKSTDDCGCAASPEMALRAVGLDPNMTRPVGQFSQGMRQRASLARVLQTDPELLLLDEPFSNLDVGSAADIVALLADFKTWPAPLGRTIVLTTHQAHLAEPIADCILTMRDGQIASRQIASRQIASRQTGSQVDGPQ